MAIPILLMGGDEPSGSTTVVAAAETTIVAEELASPVDTESSLLDDVDVTNLFDAGARPGAALSEETLEVPTAADVDRMVDAETHLSPSGAEDAASTTTAPPTTAAPTTAPPTTAPPETAPPETAPPETVPPETVPPETVPPETAPPETAPPEVAAPEVAAPEPAPQSEPTAEQWAALRMCESSGNYSIINRTGQYHGAYQFGIPTWDGVARSVGRTDLVGVLPSDAAPADQDALALALWHQRGPAPWPHCGRHLPAKP